MRAHPALVFAAAAAPGHRYTPPSPGSDPHAACAMQLAAAWATKRYERFHMPTERISAHPRRHQLRGRRPSRDPRRSQQQPWRRPRQVPRNRRLRQALRSCGPSLMQQRPAWPPSRNQTRARSSSSWRTRTSRPCGTRSAPCLPFALPHRCSGSQGPCGHQWPQLCGACSPPPQDWPVHPKEIARQKLHTCCCATRPTS